MCKILWLDDEPISISYEKNVLIPDQFPNKKLEIILFETIDELLEYISTHSIDHHDIFSIDIMLLLEERFTIPQGKTVYIENDLMAGTILYREYLKEKFPNNPTILYTSREHERDIFDPIVHDDRFNHSLFLIEKSKKDTYFLDVLTKLL